MRREAKNRSNGRHSPPRGERHSDRFERLYSSPQDGRSLGDLVRELTAQTRTLVRQEVRLATVEGSEIASRVGQSVSLAGIGAFVAYGGFLAVIVGIALLVGQVIPVWLSFSLVGLLVLSIGYALYYSGRKRLQETDFSLDRTVQSLEEDKQWMQREAEEVTSDPSRLGSDR